MRRLRRGSHWDTAWPLGPETVTGPASMIRACRCPPRLAGCRRTDEVPGAGLQEVLALLHAAPCCGQGSRCRERQRNRFYTALVACARNLQNFLSKNTSSGPPSLAAARVIRSGPPSLWRHGRPSHSGSRSPWNSL